MQTSNVYPALTRLTTATCIKESSRVPSSTSFVCDMIYCPRPWFWYVFQRRSLQRGFLCVHVIARAPTCPIFQSFVCLCETSLSNYKPIIHFKRSYMHNHAFYVLIHLMILLYHTYMLHSQSQLSIQLSLHFQFSSISTFNSVQFQSPIQLNFNFQLNSISISIQPNFNFQFNSISISNSIQFQLSIQCLCLYLWLFSTFNVSFNINFQFNSMSQSILIHSKFAFGPTIMAMSIFKSNQCQLTLNLYLFKSNSQFVSCYMSCYRSSG